VLLNPDENKEDEILEEVDENKSLLNNPKIETNNENELFFIRLGRTYDHSFLFFIFIQYFSFGVKTYMDLAVSDLFRMYLKVEPAEA